MRCPVPRLLFACLAATALACGTPAVSPDDAGAGGGAAVDSGTGGGGGGGVVDAGTGGDIDAGAGGGGDIDAGTPDAGTPDAGSTWRQPPALPTYPGTCPTLNGAPTRAQAWNTGFISRGDSRDFYLLVPPSYTPTKQYPVIFGYHWLNASANSVLDDAQLESAVAQYDFIAVVPESLHNGGNKAYQFDWPFVETFAAPKELGFFEDALACVAQQYSVDPRRIHVFGASAGGLWTAYLSTQPDVDRVASVLSVSGGLGETFGVWSIPWVAQPNTYAAMVVWGGPTDWLGVDFNAASIRYRDALRGDGHFVVECMHDQGHGIPPVTAPADGGTKFAFFWDFFAQHPYGQPAAESPYLDGGLPATYPSYCSISP